MQQLLALEPPAATVGSLVEKFARSATLSIEPVIPEHLSVAIPGLDQLTGITDSFTAILQALPQHPDLLVSDLRQEIEKLLGDTLSFDSLLSPLMEPVDQLRGGLQHFQSVFDAVAPALTQLSSTTDGVIDSIPLNSTYFNKLLPVSALADRLSQTAFNDVLTENTKLTLQIQTQLERLPIASTLQTYDVAIKSLIALPIETLSAADITVANEALGSLEATIATLNATIPSALTASERWAVALGDVSSTLSNTLDTALTRLEPSQLGALSQPFGEALTVYSIPTSFTDGMVQLETGIDAVNGLVDQGIEAITAGINTGVDGVNTAVTTVKQTIVKVSGLVTNAIEQVLDFIQSLDLTGLVNQAKLVLNDVIVKINGIFDTVNTMVVNVFAQVSALIDQVDSFDMQSVVDALHSAIAQITAFLEHPQVTDVIQQAKDTINSVAQQLDPITLTPVFDQVLTESDQVKASLQSIDVSQLNAVLKKALSVALTQLKDGLEPPTKVTDVVKNQYHETVSIQVLEQTVEPVKAMIDEAINQIYAFEPGTLVGGKLAPPFEAMVAQLKAVLSPDKLAELLEPITKFQKDLLAKIQKSINPEVVLAPILDKYEQLMSFVRSLSPEKLLQPVNQLIGQVTSYLDALNVNTIVATTVNSVHEITRSLSSLRLEDHSFWAPISAVITGGIRPLLNTLVNNLKATIQQLNLSGLEDLLAPVLNVVSPIVEQINTSTLLNRTSEIATHLATTEKNYSQQLADLAEQWQQQLTRLTAFTPLPAVSEDYQRLLTRLKALNPISALATTTSQLDKLVDISARSLNHLQTLWSTLSDRLNQSLDFVENLTTKGAAGLKAYLLDAVDALAAGPIEDIATWAAPLEQIKPILPKLLSLQRVLDPLKQILNAIQTIGNAIDGLQNNIQDINPDFLITPLNRVRDELIQPLEALNPKVTLVLPIAQLLKRVMRQLKRLSPVNLLATARGNVTLSLPSPLREEKVIPAGTLMRAATPIGDIWFETVAAVTFSPTVNPPTVNRLRVPIQALVAGTGSDIVSDEGVSWYMADPDLADPGLADIVVSRSPAEKFSERILSLTTLVNEVLFAKLDMLHPQTLIADPLNEQFKKVVDVLESLGLRQLFDALFDALNRLNTEVEEGIDTMGEALSGVVAAMPLTAGGSS